MTRLKVVVIGSVLLALFFAISLAAMEWFSRSTSPMPELAKMSPLPPASRRSFVVAPVTITLGAIRDAAERSAPRDFAGKTGNPATAVLQNADVDWTASRGPIAVTGAQDTLSFSTPLSGKLNVTGSLSAKTNDKVNDAIAGLLGASAASKIGGINIKSLNANAELKGNVVINARPKLAAGWFVEPNLGAQVSLNDSSVAVAGAKVNVPAQVKPMIDKTVADQINAVGERIRSDRSFERAARNEWSKICRSVLLRGADPAAAMPAIWLEIKPTKAIAAQPTIGASAVTAIIGIEAETRITAAETRPDCPFPEKITIIPPTTGGVGIAVPVDLPFTDLNQILNSQFAGRTFPEDGSGPVDVKVKHASLAPAGERLLISLDVHAKEKESLFGFGGDATIRIWGKPLLDPVAQTLRLGDIQLTVDSEGLLGTAARAAMPQLQKALYARAIVDLKPFATTAQKQIADAVTAFRKNEDGLKVEANINELRLADIAFDANTLRVIMEADGAVNVRLTRLPGQ
jgi:hypothetical protein